MSVIVFLKSTYMLEMSNRLFKNFDAVVSQKDRWEIKTYLMPQM